MLTAYPSDDFQFCLHRTRRPDGEENLDQITGLDPDVVQCVHQVSDGDSIDLHQLATGLFDLDLAVTGHLGPATAEGTGLTHTRVQVDLDRQATMRHSHVRDGHACAHDHGARSLVDDHPRGSVNLDIEQHTCCGRVEGFELKSRRGVGCRAGSRSGGEVLLGKRHRRRVYHVNGPSTRSPWRDWQHQQTHYQQQNEVKGEGDETWPRYLGKQE